MPSNGFQPTAIFQQLLKLFLQMKIGVLDIKVTVTDSGGARASAYFMLTVAGEVTHNGTPGADEMVDTIVRDKIYGLGGHDTLIGLAGNDSLYGAAGDDLLDGGEGADCLEGGLGNDTFVVDAAGDVVVESSNQGTDLVQSGITYTLGFNVENLTLTGASAINGTDNTLNNLILGNSGANTIDGGSGSR